MKSKIWTQKFVDIIWNPFDHKSQDLFIEEASSVLNEVFKKYDKLQNKYRSDERSAEKAIWMLHLDGLDTLRDCLALLKEKKHRIVGKLSRDITEVLDLAALFWWERDKGSRRLKKWYDDKVIRHCEFREYLGSSRGKEFQEYSARMYSDLSKWTHHCYSVLLNSYSLAGDNGEMLVYHSHTEALISPHTISQYMWEIKDLIFYFLSNIKMVGLIDWAELVCFLNKQRLGLKFI